MASNFLTSKGEAQSSGVAFAKFGMGTTQIRIVGDILPGYAYWLTNAANMKMKAPNLAFNPATEGWIKGAQDPVRDMGFTERDQTGKIVPMKSKRDYQVQIINRATSKLEVMSLSKGMFDAIVAYCQEEGIEDVSSVEFFIDKTGDQSKWNTIRYALNSVKTLKTNAKKDEILALQEGDEEILQNLKPITELFPRPTYEELRNEIEAFMVKTKQDAQANSDDGQAPADSNAREALNDLDD